MIEPSACAQIQIIDTGIGISADFLPYVFDRFRQADSTTTRPYGGLGLGLAIVRHLVEQHGGTIRADSAGEGKGATFTVNLPLLVTNATTSQPTSNPLQNGYSKLPSLDCIQVLVVEDHNDTRDFITMVLQESGAEVTAVASVQEAIEYLEQFNPHVLVSDIGMPSEDGYNLIRKVRDRESDRGNQIPAIALTAYARAEDQARALAAGFQMHVPKPVEPQELVAVVAKAVGREAP
ncbi:response regulator [Leptolyngbya sp. 7M]|uniref:ATP-binding response regulator n=1 Tax=Leptolyngbya sp. 7M TaxID=2812896 RepID=UPI001B8BEC57|nr:response regulator [Leptolyngbya sp. 7M]QYO64692.1 response regulator [Leptolyngbya sp. 7M]